MTSPYAPYMIAGLFILGVVLIARSVIKRVQKKRTGKNCELKNNYFGR
jgi:hypothetical protein